MSKDDFSALEKMTYSGRGIIVGVTPDGNSFIGYSLTGRSPSSQARELIFDENRGVVRTSVTDPKLIAEGSPALLIYPAVAHYNGKIVASNGAQTKLLYSAIRRGVESPGEIVNSMLKSFWEYDSKEGWIDITSYEPDAPNSTPRISAALNGRETVIHIVKRDQNGEATMSPNRFFLAPHEGKLITTYRGGNEKPLAPFESQPLNVIVGSNSASGIVDSIYEAIRAKSGQDNYRVAAAVMMLKNKTIECAIRNRSRIGN